jgi:MFS family permease
VAISDAITQIAAAGVRAHPAAFPRAGVLIPTLPLYARSLGVSFALVSLAVGASGLGTLLADLPAGVLLERLGRRPAMLYRCGADDGIRRKRPVLVRAW